MSGPGNKRKGKQMLTTGQIERAVEDLAADLRMSRDLRAKADESRDSGDYNEYRRYEDAVNSWINHVHAKRQVLTAMFGETFGWNVEDAAYVAVYGPHSPEMFCYIMAGYPNATFDPENREAWENAGKRESNRRKSGA
jgi:hypothetical protein